MQKSEDSIFICRIDNSAAVHAENPGILWDGILKGFHFIFEIVSSVIVYPKNSGILWGWNTKSIPFLFTN